MDFKINRCNDTLQKELGREKCHPKPIIDEWIKDINVEIWSNEKNIDMTKYGPDPTYEDDYMHDIYLLEHERFVKIFIEIS